MSFNPGIEWNSLAYKAKTSPYHDTCSKPAARLTLIPFPYALMDRLCEMATCLDDIKAEAFADLLRACPDGRQSGRTRDLVRMMCDGGMRGRVDILFDTWAFVSPATTGPEMAAALYAATVQANRMRNIAGESNP